jgi:hypothetical protein
VQGSNWPHEEPGVAEMLVGALWFSRVTTVGLDGMVMWSLGSSCVLRYMYMVEEPASAKAALTT